jgi:hypothetical protein
MPYLPRFCSICCGTRILIVSFPPCMKHAMQIAWHSSCFQEAPFFSLGPFIMNAVCSTSLFKQYSLLLHM